MSNFKDRKTKGDAYSLSILERLNAVPGVFAVINGLEHTHTNFHSYLKNYKTEDFTTIFSRYQPDGIATNISLEKTIIFEVKSSTSVEKNAFIVYNKWFEIGCRLFLIIRRKIVVESLFSEYCIPIEKIKLISGKKSVEGYTNSYPVDKDDWIAPRLWNDTNSEFYNLQKWEEYLKNRKGSGTPFRYFDFDNMERFRFSEIKDIFERIKLRKMDSETKEFETNLESELNLQDVYG